MGTRSKALASSRNFDEVYIFCSSLSFQQAPRDICMSNRSRVTAGFVKTVACIPLENERHKKKRTRKMGGAFNIWKHGKCKRKGVYFIRYKKNYTAGEHVEIMRFQTGVVRPGDFESDLVTFGFSVLLTVILSILVQIVIPIKNRFSILIG